MTYKVVREPNSNDVGTIILLTLYDAGIKHHLLSNRHCFLDDWENILNSRPNEARNEIVDLIELVDRWVLNVAWDCGLFKDPLIGVPLVSSDISQY